MAQTRRVTARKNGAHSNSLPTPARKKTTRRAPTRKKPLKKWSQRVTETSDAMTLEESVFKLRSPRAIAASLKRSAEGSRRRKSPPFRSAMSMLNFYINRAGRNLSAPQRRKLESAKQELRALFERGTARS